MVRKLAVALTLSLLSINAEAKAPAQAIEDVVMHPQRSLDSVNISGKEQIDCGYIKNRKPIVIFGAGQSLIANTNGDLPWNRTITRNVYEQWGTLCYKANAPLYGASDTRQSFVLLLGEYIARTTERDVVINMAAVGGTPISEFIHGTANSLLTTQLHNMQQAGFTPDFVIWEHGQADAGRGAGQYANDVKTVLGIFRSSGITAPIFVPTDTMMEWRVNEALRQEQQSVLGFENVLPGPDVDLVRFRYDGTHLDQRGLEMQAAMWFQALDQHFHWHSRRTEQDAIK